jgi:hypothetical protein
VDADLTAAVSSLLSIKGSTVTIGSGSLPCGSVNVWVASFDLAHSASEDPEPVIVRQVTNGGPAQTFVFPAPGEKCRAAAAYLQGTSDLSSNASDVRDAVEDWPATRTATLPTAAFQRDHPDAHIIAALSVSGPCTDDSRAVSSPIGKVRDCWTSSAGSSSSLSNVEATYTAVACSAAHTHEIYWAETPKAADYQKAYPSHGTPPATWARKRADKVCTAKQSTIRLASGVRASTIGVSYLWPTDLESDPKADGYAASWAQGQIVCLVRHLDGKARSTRILR